MQRVTSSSPECVALVDEAVAQYLSLSGDPVSLLLRASRADADAPLPHALLAALYLLGSNSAARAPAVLAARAAAARAVRAGACAPREAALALAVEAACAARWRFACQVLEAQLARAPGDALLLRVAHDLYFFLGDSRNLRDGVARAFQSWEPTMPHYGRVCGMLAFGLEETGAYERAEELAMTALTLDPADAWAAHAATHVYEMAARREDGERFLRETEDGWAGAALFARHIHWHWALFHAAAGGARAYRQAIARYDSAIAAGAGGPSSGEGGGGGSAAVAAAKAAAEAVRADALTLVDATSLLWRLQLMHHPLALLPPADGLPAPSAEAAPAPLALAAGAPGAPAPFTRWHDLADRWRESLRRQLAGERVYAFNDVHAVMAASAAEHWCNGAASGVGADASAGAGASAGTGAGTFAGGLAELLASICGYAARGGPDVAPRGDEWLRALVERDGYDLAALGLGPGARGAHAHSALPPTLAPGAEGGAASFAPHLPLAALSDNWAATAAAGAELARGLAAFAAGDFGAAFAALQRSRPHWQLLGGSHAQRDVFEQTLLHAAAGAGELAAARALAGERLCARPNDGVAWYMYGALLRRSGDERGAADAVNRAYVLGVSQGPHY